MAWTPRECESSIEGAAGFVLGLLRSKPSLRRKFPTAISSGAGGNYCQWLLRHSWRWRISQRGRENICTAFATNPGERIVEFYLHFPELWPRFPGALLCDRQQKFVSWLLKSGREHYLFSSVEILWFLHRAAEESLGMTQTTWLINPAWQEAWPEVPNARNLAAFRAQLKGIAPAITTVPSVPNDSWTEAKPQTRGVNLLSHFCYPSGIQRAATQIRKAFEKVGWETSCRDVPNSPLVDSERRQPFLGLEIFPATITNVAPEPHFHQLYQRAGLRRRPGVHRIAYWSWELEHIPPEWADLARTMDEIWTPTPFVTRAFQDRVPVPAHEVLPGLELEDSIPFDRKILPSENYVFLFMFDMASVMERKNPLGLLRAFKAAFPRARDVSLILKINRASLVPENLAQLRAAANDDRVLIIEELFSHKQVHGLMEASDCFVSLHRSEGFGLGLAEAMLLGKPVIGTRYSGNLAFMHEGNSLLVDYRLTPVPAGLPIYRAGNHWADPSIEHAVELLRFCYEHRAEAAQLGHAARVELREKFCLASAGRRMIDRLAASGVGPQT